MHKEFILQLHMHKLHVVLAVPAARPQKNEDKERQSTSWQNDNEMQRAIRLQYPVFLQPDQSMPEINVSINLGSGHFRNTRQTGLQGPATSSKLATLIMSWSLTLVLTLLSIIISLLRLMHEGGL